MSTRPVSALDVALAAAARFGGLDEQALRQQVEGQCERREDTERKQREALAIGEARLARGEGQEHEADRARSTLPRTSPPRPSLPRPPRAGAAKVKQAQREERKLKPLLQQRQQRDNSREATQAEQMAHKALQSHGIYHHYRRLPKLAFFSAYMAQCDRNGMLALQTLAQINMPRARMTQVLQAAYQPAGYTPSRDVFRGKRAEQQRRKYDGRPFGKRPLSDGGSVDRPGWSEGTRDVDHAAAIRVIGCAIFLWLSKGRTRRRGYSYVVRGFGRGVFSSICQCSKDAITGQTEGMPGALRALAQSGFLQYGQPPAQAVTKLDRGPSGHAYNVYWLGATPEEAAVQSLHERILGLSKLPVLERLLADPSQLDATRVEGPPATAPPFSDVDIPY